jgi:hypothetical protein
MTSVTVELAQWAAGLRPTPDDLALADRSLTDAVAVTLAALDDPVTRLAAGLPDGARWAVAEHALDFDDLHKFQAELADCVRGLDTDPGSWTWKNAAATLRRLILAPPATAPLKSEKDRAWMS